MSTAHSRCSVGCCAACGSAVFCIAAFVVLLILGAFSARYRVLLRKAWTCTSRRLTLRACDTGFREDAKSRMLAPLALRHPALVLPASVALEVLAWLLILTTVWSLYTVAKSSTNLAVYGTCNPQDAASCSLGAEACSIDSGTPDFWQSVGRGDVVGAVVNDVAGFGETIAAIPARLRAWDAAEFAPADASYLSGFDGRLPVALEVIDPGCSVCRHLFENILESGFDERHNLTYLAYAIPTGSGSKFPNSPLVVSMLQAIRMQPVIDSGMPVDWRILERIYTGDIDGRPAQDVINESTRQEAEAILAGWLVEWGYTPEQAAATQSLAASDRVAAAVQHSADVVRDEIDTVKIPTIIFGGGRHDGLVDVSGLR